MDNLDKFKNLVSSEPSTWSEKSAWRKENEEWLDESFKVATIILRTLRKRKMHQSDLASLMGVTPQHINKILKGQENLSIGTIKKFERTLGIPILKILVSEPEANYTMNVSVGSREFNFVVKGRKSEESYAELLHGNDKTALTMYVSTNSSSSTTITEACIQEN